MESTRNSSRRKPASTAQEDEGTYTVVELQRVARELEIKGRSRMRKKELFDLLETIPGARSLLKRWRKKVEKDVDASSPLPATETDPTGGASPPTRAKPLDIEAGRPSTPSPSPGSSELASVRSESLARAASQPPLVGSSTRSTVSVSRLGLVGVDPHTAFAYWKISAAVVDRARAHLGDQTTTAIDDAEDAGYRLILRAFDVTDIVFDGTNARGCQEVDIGDRSSAPYRGRRYLKLDEPGRSIYSEIVVRAANGREQAIAWSNYVQLPLGKEPPVYHMELHSVNPSRSGHWQARLPSPVAPSESSVASTGRRAQQTPSGSPVAGPAASSETGPQSDEGDATSKKPLFDSVPYPVVGISSGIVIGGPGKTPWGTSGPSSPSSSDALSSWGRRETDSETSS